MKNQITGIILCGGENKRMGGRNKAFLKLKNRYFIDIIIEILQDITSRIIIVTNTPKDFNGYGFKTYTDIIKKKTPISGIHSGLKNMETEYGFITACDSPFLNKEMLKLLFNETEDKFDIITPNQGTYFQPLCSIYSKKCIKSAEFLLKKGEVKVDRLFEMVRLKKVPYEKLQTKDPELRSFININSPEDIDLFI